MPNSRVTTMCTVAAQSRGTSCSSRYVQADITSSSIGLQCDLVLLSSASSQTEEEFSVRDVDEVQDGSSVPASLDGAEIAAEAGPKTCSCQLLSGNARCSSSYSKKKQFGRMLHSCPSCGQRNRQITHEEVCATKLPYICTVCKKAFRKKCNLDLHMRGLHYGQNLYVCSTCNKSFVYKSALVCHERVHSGEKPYVCSICQKSFKRSHSMVAHQRSHSGERPYVCRFCQKSFTYRDHLVEHERGHTGERPYACVVCQKRFITSSKLARHEKIHTGYVCQICQKSFTQKCHLHLS